MVLNRRLHGNFILGLLFTMFIIGMASCKSKKPTGEGYLNYPDMNVIIKDNLVGFKTFPKSFTLVTTQGTQRDTQQVPAANLDWAYYENTLRKTNIFSKSFDRKYKIEALNDDMTATVTYLYQANDLSCKTKKINVITDMFDNSVKSIYVEYEDPGFFTSEYYKILFVYGKSLQIQERRKQPFQKMKSVVRQINF